MSKHYENRIRRHRLFWAVQRNSDGSASRSCYAGYRPDKVTLLTQKQPPIEDKEIEDFLKKKLPNFHATLDKAHAYTAADFVIIANRNTKTLADVVDKLSTRDLLWSNS